LNIALYSNNLFSVVSCDFLPSSQYIFPNYNSSCLRLVSMCFFQFSLRSRCIPKYLVSSVCGIVYPFSVTNGHVSLRVVKSALIIPLALILHFLNYLDVPVLSMMILCDCCELQYSYVIGIDCCYGIQSEFQSKKICCVKVALSKCCHEALQS